MGLDASLGFDVAVAFAFAVIATLGSLRAALERHADGLLDRVAPYQPFGTGSWSELTA